MSGNAIHEIQIIYTGKIVAQMLVFNKSRHLYDYFLSLDDFPCANGGKKGSLL